MIQLTSGMNALSMGSTGYDLTVKDIEALTSLPQPLSQLVWGYYEPSVPGVVAQFKMLPSRSPYVTRFEFELESADSRSVLTGCAISYDANLRHHKLFLTCYTDSVECIKNIFKSWQLAWSEASDDAYDRTKFTFSKKQ